MGDGVIAASHFFGAFDCSLRDSNILVQFAREQRE